MRRTEYGVIRPRSAPRCRAGGGRGRWLLDENARNHSSKAAFAWACGFVLPAMEVGRRGLLVEVVFPYWPPGFSS